MTLLTDELSRRLLAGPSTEWSAAPVLLLRRQRIVLRFELEQLVKVAAEIGPRVARRFVDPGCLAQDRIVKAVESASHR